VVEVARRGVRTNPGRTAIQVEVPLAARQRHRPGPRRRSDRARHPQHTRCHPLKPSRPARHRLGRVEPREASHTEQQLTDPAVPELPRSGRPWPQPRAPTPGCSQRDIGNNERHGPDQRSVERRFDRDTRELTCRRALPRGDGRKPCLIGARSRATCAWVLPSCATAPPAKGPEPMRLWVYAMNSVGAVG